MATLEEGVTSFITRECHYVHVFIVTMTEKAVFYACMIPSHLVSLSGDYKILGSISLILLIMTGEQCRHNATLRTPRRRSEVQREEEGHEYCLV